MSKAARIYQEKLSERGYGTPLWAPEPSPWEVHIGDVGLVDETGSWCRLFNVLHTHESSLNKRGVPDDFQPLITHTMEVRRISGYLDPGVYSSESVRTVSGGANMSMSMESGTLTCTYVCVEQSGALLALQGKGHLEHVVHNQDWVDYMYAHHASWHRFARDICRLIVDREDIILVRGWIKADKWAVASFINQGQSLQFSLGGGVVPYGSLGVAVTHHRQQTHSPESRRSPSFCTGSHSLFDPSSTPPSDIGEQSPDTATHCVFLRSYKAKYRFLNKHPWEIRGDGDPGRSYEDGHDRSPPEASNIDSSVVAVYMDPEETKPHRLIDKMLDDLLSSTDADVAIALDDPFEATTFGSANYATKDLVYTKTASGVATLAFDRHTMGAHPSPSDPVEDTASDRSVSPEEIPSIDSPPSTPSYFRVIHDTVLMLENTLYSLKRYIELHSNTVQSLQEIEDLYLTFRSIIGEFRDMVLHASTHANFLVATIFDRLLSEHSAENRYAISLFIGTHPPKVALVKKLTRRAEAFRKFLFQRTSSLSDFPGISPTSAFNRMTTVIDGIRSVAGFYFQIEHFCSKALAEWDNNRETLAEAIISETAWLTAVAQDYTMFGQSQCYRHIIESQENIDPSTMIRYGDSECSLMLDYRLVSQQYGKCAATVLGHNEGMRRGDKV